MLQSLLTYLFLLLLPFCPHFVKAANSPVVFYVMFLLESWLNLCILLSLLISGLRNCRASVTGAFRSDFYFFKGEKKISAMSNAFYLELNS